MQVRNVSICPAPQAAALGRDALTPELLASVGARYSRDNEGLDSILARVRSMDPDKAVDSIFKFIDYGHASVGDCVPVAIFMDDIPIYDVYFLWSICPLAGGQESSTRYIKIDPSGLADPVALGIKDVAEWSASMGLAYDAYSTALAFWEKLAVADPALCRIPPSLLSDTSDKGKKQAARMRRNYAFDRARIFLPVAANTNVMMVQSARAWAQAIQTLLSSPLPSLKALGVAIRGELALSAPRLVRHARVDSSAQAVLARNMKRMSEYARKVGEIAASAGARPGRLFDEPCDVDIAMFGMDTETSRATILEDLQDRTSRYSMVGEKLSLCPVEYTFGAIAMAELRDMNRHRTGTKSRHLSPVGFYTAREQIPTGLCAAGVVSHDDRSAYELLAEFGIRQSERALQLLKDGDPTYIYYSLLGTQYSFSHVTTADKFIYTMELRTGVGAHYRYARHCHDLLEIWYEHFPEHRGVIFEGSAELE